MLFSGKWLRNQPPIFIILLCVCELGGDEKSAHHEGFIHEVRKRERERGRERERERGRGRERERERERERGREGGRETSFSSFLQVHGREILVKFSERFHERFHNEDYDIMFTFNR